MDCHVTFLPEGKTVDVPEGTTISNAAVKAGVKIKLPCAGNGRCGKCIVEVGNERVLACQTKVSDGMFVTISQDEAGKVIAATDHRPIEIEDISPISDGYGLAVDIGTTTVAAEIIAGRPPRKEMATAIVNDANSPTRGSTPAMIENAIASGIHWIAAAE